jgi:hypothetical protein
VGFEYGPTAAGEMDTLAETLLTHILTRGARPVIVSTNPAGTIHARDVLARLGRDEFLLAHLDRSRADVLIMPFDYVVLPYLPGGAVGLRSLSGRADGGSLDRGVFGVDLEGHPTGLDVTGLGQSFELAIVLAEQGENVRQWVEQVGVAGGLQLGAAVSAAAEPLARPYFESEQLIGLLAGYRDAYSYDQVLLAALPPVQPVAVWATSTPAPEDADADEVALPTGEADVDAGLAFVDTPVPGATAATAVAQGLVTNTPLPTDIPTETPTPQPTLTAPGDDEADAAATDQGDDQPAATATQRVFVTATPSGVDAAPADDAPDAPVSVAASNVDAEGNLLPNRSYRAERWTSLSLGAVFAAVVIGLGAIVNVVRGLRRRRD